MNPQLETRLAIHEVIENWVLWRDAGDWDRFRTVWHDDGRMMATWFQGSADEFIRVTQEGWAKGVSILHFLGGSSIDVSGHRAIAQTKMTISQRGDVDGALCDVVCTGRFYDFMEERQGKWGVVLRQPIYEKTAWTWSIPRPPCPSTASCSPAFRRATGTSPTFRQRSATRSNPTCPASVVMRCRRCTKRR
ncbi:nuclear transport factor 2 family protein [Polaromonas sp. P1(28)-13]|nr:nuclear transport factor 2 family protein [Polaromonas sp. P1(28)-13]